MISVWVEVETGAACFSVAVRAESIVRAVGIAQTLYPGSEVRVVCPINPEAFFVKNPAVAPRLAEIEVLERAAG